MLAMSSRGAGGDRDAGGTATRSGPWCPPRGDWEGQGQRDHHRVPTLIEMLEQECDPQWVGALMAALGRSDDAQALPVLLAKLEHAKESMRRDAIRALGTLGDERAIPRLIAL